MKSINILGKKSSLILVLLIILLNSCEASYSIQVNCGKSISGCPANSDGTSCNKCIAIQGVPFTSQNLVTCADSNTQLQNYCGSFITFSCSSSCSIGTNYFQTNSLAGFYNGCVSQNDIFWNCPSCSNPGVGQILDFAYSLYTGIPNSQYNWNSGGCWITAGAIAGIVIGCVAFIALIVLGIVCYRKKTMQKSIIDDQYSVQTTPKQLAKNFRMN